MILINLTFLSKMTLLMIDVKGLAIFKAGICFFKCLVLFIFLQPNVPAVSVQQPKAAMEVLKDRAKEIGVGYGCY